jgi:serralysin
MWRRPALIRCSTTQRPAGWKAADASIAFDTAGYLSANPDVAAAGINPLDHFLQFGIHEGRPPVNDGVWG